MKKMLAFLLFLAPAARADRPTWRETSLIAVSTSAILVDMMTTIDAHRRGYTERNPLVRGSASHMLIDPGIPQRLPDPIIRRYNPSTEKIVIMSGLAITSSVVIWYVLPHPWRSIFAGGLIVVEGLNDARQFSIGLNMAL